MQYDQSLSSILFVDYGKLILFIPPDKIIQLNIPANIINNLDLVNTVQLHSLIKAFTEYHKILPCKIYILLSGNVCFEKIFQKNEVSLDDKIRDFLNKVPFENVLSRKYESDKNISLTAVNADVFLEMKKAFEKIHFGVESIIPFSMFSGKIKTFDLHAAKQLLSETGTLKQLNIIRKEIPATQQTKKEYIQNGVKPKKAKNDNRTLLISIPVFIILIIILIFIYLQSAKPQKQSYMNPNIATNLLTNNI